MKPEDPEKGGYVHVVDKTASCTTTLSIDAPCRKFFCSDGKVHCFRSQVTELKRRVTGALTWEPCKLWATDDIDSGDELSMFIISPSHISQA